MVWKSDMMKRYVVYVVKYVVKTSDIPFTHLTRTHPISILSVITEVNRGLWKEVLKDWSCIPLRSALESIVLFDRREVDSET